MSIFDLRQSVIDGYRILEIRFTVTLMFLANPLTLSPLHRTFLPLEKGGDLKGWE
jgi:hypothetical protein